MPWPGILAKLSPERVTPILREGQCKPVSDYEYVLNLLRDLLLKGPPLAF